MFHDLSHFQIHMQKNWRCFKNRSFNIPFGWFSRPRPGRFSPATRRSVLEDDGKKSGSFGARDLELWVKMDEFFFCKGN